MPRRSAEALEIMPNVVDDGRPDAPYSLGDEEADEWRAIVASVQPNHFARGNYSLLEQLCRHTVSARVVGSLITALRKQKQFDQAELTHLLSLQDRETRAIVYLARALRLSQISLYRSDMKKLRPLNGRGGTGLVNNPWVDDE